MTDKNDPDLYAKIVEINPIMKDLIDDGMTTREDLVKQRAYWVKKRDGAEKYVQDHDRLLHYWDMKHESLEDG